MVEGRGTVSDEYKVNVEKKDRYPFNSKTFWIAIVCIALGIYLITVGEKEEGMQLILLGLGLLGVRDAIRKVQK